MRPSFVCALIIIAVLFTVLDLSVYAPFYKQSVIRQAVCALTATSQTSPPSAPETIPATTQPPTPAPPRAEFSMDNFTRQVPLDLRPLCITRSTPERLNFSVMFSPEWGGPTYAQSKIGLESSLVRAAERLGIKSYNNVHFRICGPCHEPLPAVRLVVYWQMEQIVARGDILPYFSWQNNTHVWDFSTANLSYLSKFRNGTNLSYIPLWHTLSCKDFSFEPGSTEKSVPPQLDVFFFGAMNGRRNALRDEMTKAGLAAWIGSIHPGDQQDALLRQAKVVLCLHFYEGASLEVHRINRILALGKCVVAEHSSDRVLDFIYSEVVIFAPYAELTDHVKQLIKYPKRLAECEERSRRWMYERVMHDTRQLDEALLRVIV